jgi:excinuclease ABC subunit C
MESQVQKHAEEKVSSTEKIAQLRRKASALPERPGVYLHKDAKGKILYVGKAKNLSNRVRSYFTSVHNHAAKTKALVERIFDFDVMLVENENESLILENNLIKHNLPPYNILLRDDKTYPYIKLTTDEEWPRIVQTRRRKNDGCVYFGPYANASEIYKILNVINRFFPLVKCSPYQFSSVKRPCNYYDIKKCLAPCHLKVEKSEYNSMVSNISKILLGHASEIIETLKKDMHNAAENLNYEKAALVRDQINALKSLSKSHSVTLQPNLNADIFGICSQQEKTSFFVSIVRNGKMVASESKIVSESAEILNAEEYLTEEFSIQTNQTLGIAELKTISQIKSFLGVFYTKREIPKFVCLPKIHQNLFKHDKKTYENFLSHLKQTHFSSTEPCFIHFEKKCPQTDGLETKQVAILNTSFCALGEMCLDNAKNILVEALNIEEKHLKMLECAKVFLNLQKTPVWIECYDISTFQGSQTVASGVVFKNGKPAKNEYRKYIIKEVVGQDDFASLREVVSRRFSDERKHEIPDILMLDGGEPQLREVGYTLRNMGLGNICVVGLAKSRTQRSFTSSTVTASQERIVIPKRNEEGVLIPEEHPTTQFLKTGSPEFRLFTQIRDEAHRVAISFHRQRREKITKQSLLKSVTGLGPKRRKILMENFESVLALKEASLEELMQKGQLPSRVAEELFKVLKG